MSVPQAESSHRPQRHPAPAEPGYRLAHHFILAERRTLLWMNLLGSVLFVVMLGVVFALLAVYRAIGAPLILPGLPESLSVGAYLLMAVGTLLLHEGLHGAAIRLRGHRPRFGMKLSKLVLYTTSDAYFSRGEYLLVTLAPLIGIGLLGVGAMLLVPRGVALWLGIMVALNTASSIGDLWMAAVTASFPPEARFRDEEDGLSAYLPAGIPAGTPGGEGGQPQ